MTRERIRQIERAALRRLDHSGNVHELLPQSPYLRFKKAIADGHLGEVRRLAARVAPIAADPVLTGHSIRPLEVDDVERDGVRDGRRALADICEANGLKRARPVLLDQDRRA